MKLSGAFFCKNARKNFLKLDLVLLLVLKSNALYFSNDKSVSQVPGSIGVGAHGVKVRVIPAMGA